MAAESLRREVPTSGEEAAAAIAAAATAGASVRLAGGGTKAAWGGVGAPTDLEVSTTGLDRVLEHNEADFTAVLESGVPFGEVQRRFAAAGQMLALDPPLGEGDAATVGGVFATADSGPLRHRYGAPRDLIVGVTLALADGTLAKAGGKVIKNVAGYDLAKLFSGAFGTLGLIVNVSVRLHPAPDTTASAVAEAGDPEALGRAAGTLAHSPLEAEALDLRWSGGRGAVLARFGGAAAGDQAEAAVHALEHGGVEVEASVVHDDADPWAEQRTRQRSAEATVVKVSALQSRLPDVLRAADRAGAAVVGRAAHALCWVTLPVAEPAELVGAVERLRAELKPCPCVVLDASRWVREGLDVWGEQDRVTLELSRRLKHRFDPHTTCNPGIFVGGI